MAQGQHAVDLGVQQAVTVTPDNKHSKKPSPAGWMAKHLERPSHV